MLTVAELAAAATRLAGRVERTPIVAVGSTGLRAKCENLQRSGSFKIRGATNAVLGLGPAAVVTASSGNHGLAVASAAREAGIPATVVMTTETEPFKRAAVEAAGARVVFTAPGSDVRNRTAAELAEAEGATLIPPYDHPLVMAGQGTIGLEIVAQVPDVATVVVPVGGGGLISGIASAVRAGEGAHIRVLGVEPAAGDDTVRSLRAGHRVHIEPPRTICDGAAVQSPGELTFPILAALVDEVIAVTDAEVIAAMRVLFAAGLVVEPTGALAVAGALALGLGAGTVCVLSGRNVSPEAFAGYIGTP